VLAIEGLVKNRRMASESRGEDHRSRPY
jgi:hypothetical protein